MTPVISPWVFYFMSLFGNLSVLAIIGLITSIIALCIALFVHFVFLDCFEDDDSEMIKLNKITKKIIAVLTISGLLTCVIPNETTMTKMILAQNVTYERVETVTDTVTTVYNDIMDLFQESGDSDG